MLRSDVFTDAPECAERVAELCRVLPLAFRTRERAMKRAIEIGALALLGLALTAWVVALYWAAKAFTWLFL